MKQGLAAAALACVLVALGDGTPATICGADRVQARAEILWTRAICKSGRYIGWPTVCRRRNGELLAVFSGDRDGHICPFGKTQLVRSTDGGETWTDARTIHSSAVDDRDAGICELANGDLVVFWFSSSCYATTGNATYARVFEKIPPDVAERSIGYFSMRSTDGGATWEEPVRMPTSANHGGIQLKDGRLLMVGRSWNAQGNVYLRPGETQTPYHRLIVQESTDAARSWHVLAELTPPAPLSVSNFHEPHLVELPDGRIVAQFRCHEADMHLCQSESADGGRTWTPIHVLAIDGLPPHLIVLKDGRLLTTYGRRKAQPSGMGEYACLSEDGGQTWDVAHEIKLSQGPDGDLGYPSTVQNDDGTLVTVYYQKENAGEPCCLMATKWCLRGAVGGVRTRVTAGTIDSMATGAVFHLDVSASDSVTRKTINNLPYMTHLRDLAGGQNLSSAFGMEEGWPPCDLRGGCNGHDVADFDTRAAWQADKNRFAPVRAFAWPTRLANIRTVFWMWRDHPTSGGGWLLGDGQGTAERPSDFTRGNLGADGARSAYFDAVKASPHVLNGSLRCDGVEVAPTNAPKAGWQTLSLVTTGPCAADRIAADRVYNGNLTAENMSHWGGLQLGELIVYDRALTENERTATESYLMTKWGAPHPVSDDTVGLVYGGTTVTPVGTEGVVCGLAGTGTVVFEGGTTTVQTDAGGLVGRVALTNGATVKLLGADYSSIVLNLASGTTLDLCGGTVKVKSLEGAGRVVNGRLIDVTAGTVIVFR